MTTRQLGPNRVRVVATAVAERYGVDVSDVYSKNRKRPLPFVRSVIYKLLRDNTDMTLDAIAGMFSTDHSTVHYGLAVINERVAGDLVVSAVIDAIAKAFLEPEDADRLTELAIESACAREGLKAEGVDVRMIPSSRLRVCGGTGEPATISIELPLSSAELLNQVSAMGLWGTTREEVCRRFVDEGLRRLVMGTGKTLTLRVVQ